jgi:hypothetical protein
VHARPLMLALTLLVGCSNSSTGPSVYTILIQPTVSAFYGLDLWSAADSGVFFLWHAPAQGWDTVPVGGVWCVHVPTTEQVVGVKDSQPAPVNPPVVHVGYVHLSPGAANWRTGSVLDSAGQLKFFPGPGC